MNTICKVIFLLTVIISGHACSKKESQYGFHYPDEVIPRSSVPEALNFGSWFTGTVSAISHFDRDGHQLGNDYEAGREYQFFNDNQGVGRLKFWQYLGMRNFSGCVTEIFTYKEGTVGFEGQRFSFYPVKGNFRTVKKDCTVDSNSSRYADKSELEPVTFRWKIIDLEGKPHFYVYADEDVNYENVLFVFENIEN